MAYAPFNIFNKKLARKLRFEAVHIWIEGPAARFAARKFSNIPWRGGARARQAVVTKCSDCH